MSIFVSSKYRQVITYSIMKQENIPWELIISKFKQEISEKDDARLMSWAERPECRSVMEDLNVVWKRVQEKTSDYTPDKEYYWKVLSARIGKAGKPQVEVLQEKASGKTFTLRSLYRYIAAACVVLVLSVGMSYYWGVSMGRQPMGEQVYTSMDGKSKIFLPDGTGVWLQANTTLAYGNDFRDRDRSVRLSGEAYFEVAEDKRKPFIVRTEGMQVRVHGTKFNVASPDGAAESRVSLMEGSVSLETRAGLVFLKPGEIAVYDKKNNRLAIDAGDVALEKMWIQDEFFVSNKTLGEVCRILSKRYDVEIKVDDELEDKYRYTFTLRNETLEEIVRIMARINPIAYHFDDNNVLVINQKWENKEGKGKK